MTRSDARRPAAPELVLAVLLVLVLALMSRASESFSRPQNLLDMTRHFAEPGLIALAMTMVIITGGIDLSVGSTVALSAVCLGHASDEWSLGVWAAVGVAIAAGCICGLFNGAMVAFFRVPPLIVTLATLAVYRGLALGISRGEPAGDFDKSFQMLGKGYYPLPWGLEMPGQLLLLIILAVVAGVFLARTRYGRYLYAIGLNESAARYAGLPVTGMKLLVYTLSGTLAGLAASVYVSRMWSATENAGKGLELEVIAACVLGGVSIYGGRGSILGAVLGLAILGSLRWGLELNSTIEAESIDILLGLALILAVFAHQVLAPALQKALPGRRSERQAKEESL